MDLASLHEKVFLMLSSPYVVENFKEFIEKVSGEECDEDISLYFTCFNGAVYIAWLWGATLPLPLEEATVINPEELYHLHGVFHFALSTSLKEHHFVMCMLDETLYIYNSYGGTEKFFVSSFYRKEWLELFLDLDQTIRENKYHLLWGFNSSMTCKIVADAKKFQFFELKALKLL